MTETPARKARAVARRYFEGMETERVALVKRVADLERELAAATHHHAEAHAECDGAKTGATREPPRSSSA